MNFETDKALLIGESLLVAKEANAIFNADTSLGNCLNVVYSLSTVTKGCVTSIVYAIGIKTEIGSIALALQATNKRTYKPRQSKDGRVKPHRYVEA